MSLLNRAQQVGRNEAWQRSQQAQGQLGQTETGKTQFNLAGGPYWAIVDGEIVNVIGSGDVQGMSPAYLCSDRDGNSAPVSILEARIFTTPQEALAALDQQRGVGTQQRTQGGQLVR